MDPGATIGARPVRCLQVVFPHQTPYPFLRDRNTPVPEPERTNRRSSGTLLRILLLRNTNWVLFSF